MPMQPSRFSAKPSENMGKLVVAQSLRELSFGKLMEVYSESNLENGRDLWPNETEGRLLALAEQEFYNYLQQVFFRTSGAQYLIWEADGCYVSALRLEPYRDGLLLEALETAPQHRGKGYAAALMQAALESAGSMKVYSHVGKKNAASLRVHEKCGFMRISESAVYADGSVDSRCCTLCFCKSSAQERVIK